MILTLSVSGGFTGLAKESTIEVESMDSKTRNDLMKYFKTAAPIDANTNLVESWSLDDGREVEINSKLFSPVLKNLYNKMKKNLTYLKR